MALVRPRQIDAVEAPSPRDGQETGRDDIQRLASPDASERRAAARGLGQTAEGAALLVSHLAVERAPSVRGAILNALSENKSTAIARAMTVYLTAEDTALRSAVVETLQGMPDEIEPLLDDLLSSEDSDVRILAVNIASTMAHGRAPELLIRVIETDAHVNVCAAAVDGLAEIGDDSAAAPLQALADRFPDVPFIVFAVDIALRRIASL